jgi:flagellar basal-body rod protein FlgC
MDDIARTLRISAAGMRVQGARIRMITENIANADTTAAAPGGEPYRRQVMTFRNAFDREIGADTVRIGKVSRDPSPFVEKFDPGHPAADARGYVRTANVSALIETADLKEAQRSYEANLGVIKASKSMLQQTIDVLR